MKQVGIWILMVGLLGSVGDALGDETCWVCARYLGPREPRMQGVDQVAREERVICVPCSEIEQLCFLCGLPFRDSGKQLIDGRHYCLRHAELAVFTSVEVERAAREMREMMARPLARFMTLPDANVEWVVEDLGTRNAALERVPSRCLAPGVRFEIVPDPEFGVRYRFGILNGLHREKIEESAVHLYAHAWLMEEMPERRRVQSTTVEGFCDLVTWHVLRGLGRAQAAERVRVASRSAGQLEALLEAYSIYGLGPIQEWMRFGAADQLLAGDDHRIRQLDENLTPRRKIPRRVIPPSGAIRRGPDELVLRGVLGSGEHQLALVNDVTLAVGETGKARVGTNVVTIECLEIGLQRVVVRLPDGALLELRRSEP